MASTAHSSMPDTPGARRRDWQVISLVGAAHACSHFFQLVFATLYLSLNQEFGYDFAQLGLLVAIFFLVSCLGQASSGFIVDRIGAAPVLRFGLVCFIISAVLIGVAPGYWVLMLAAVIGGIGNAIFHPVDFAILNHRVSPGRLGHAFSTHGFTGYLGWALTPVFMATLIELYNWRVAALGAGVLVALVLLATVLFGRCLSGHESAQASAAAPSQSARSAASTTADLSNQTVAQTLAALLAQPALWGAFLFFAFTAAALSAVQNYTIPTLGALYQIDAIMAGTALSAYMVTAALGLVVGGFLAGATAMCERIVLASLLAAGACLAVLASGVLPSFLVLAFLAFTGFLAGISGPSRDMLIRRVAPKGATGAVYGLVYSGMDVGSSLAPVLFGLMLDAGVRQGPWYAAGVCFVVGGFMAVWVAQAAARRQAGVSAAAAH